MAKIEEYIIRNNGIKHTTKIILLVSVLALYFAPGVNAVNNPEKPDPQGFQRLIDFNLFENTGAFQGSMAEYILVPAGFFKQMEAPNIKFVQPFMPPNQMKNTHDYSMGKIQALPGDIIFTGNVTELWNESTNGTWATGYMVPDLDGDGLNDTLVTVQKYDQGTGIYTHTFIAAKGTDGTHLWQESISGSNVWLSGYPAGDLNGDGLTDVLVNGCNYDQGTSTYKCGLAAKKGINGMNLWHESIGGSSVGLSAYPAGDLNGDGLVDVLVNGYMYDPGTGTYTYTLIAEKGTDGSHLWQESISGSSVWLSASPAGDLNGDGLDDVLVDVSKYDPGTGIYTYTLIAEKGTDGKALWKKSISGSSVWLFGYIVDEMSGDGLADVLVSTYRYDPGTSTTTYTLIAAKGTDGSHLWQESISGSGVSLSASPAGDLNGDGLTDVFVNGCKYDQGTGNYNCGLAAKKGNNGMDLWQESISGNSVGLSASPAGDLNGDGLVDVLVNGYKYDSGTGTYTYTLIAEKGIDGMRLWHESISGSSVGLYASPSEDLNGDGLDDVLVNRYKYDPGTGISTYTLIAKKGIDGTHLWQESMSGSSVWLSASPSDDLNGDGLTDVLVTINDWGISTYALDAKKGIDGTNLWKAISDTWIWYGGGNNTADLNGDKISDLLLGTSSKVYAVTST